MSEVVVTKKMFLWNLVGCIINAATSFFMLALVTRNTGLTDAGYFSIAFATAQMLLTFGKYGVRAYQVTDVNHEISAKSYLVHRAFVVVGMLLLATGFVWLSGYSSYKSMIVLCVCGIKALDAVEDVFHGELQRDGRMDLAGKLLTARNMLTLLLFAVVISLSKNLMFSCVLTLVISFAFCFLVNWLVTRKKTDITGKVCAKELMRIFKECLPLFIGQFFSIVIYNMPKYAIDAVASSELQAIYSMIFMPAFVINMISEFIFKPLLTPLAAYWEKENYQAAKKIIKTLYLAVFGIAIVTLLGGFLLGIPLLDWFYGVELGAYKVELMLLLAGGGFSATVYLTYNLLTLLRAQKAILLGYFGGMVMMCAVAWIFVIQYGITGGAVAYLLVECVMAAYFIGRLVVKVRR